MGQLVSAGRLKHFACVFYADVYFYNSELWVPGTLLTNMAWPSFQQGYHMPVKVLDGVIYQSPIFNGTAVSIIYPIK